MSDVRSITHEAEIHHHILQSLAHPRVATTITTFRVSFPLSHGLLPHTNSAACSQILPRLPAGYAACNALISEKIHPVPFRMRKLLLEQLTACEDPQKNVRRLMFFRFLGRLDSLRRDMNTPIMRVTSNINMQFNHLNILMITKCATRHVHWMPLRFY
ncbi:hypothetical protein CGCSCA5_v011062 [Colletotrichum siamense]|nr:hypothetical protein CGCSCA5_v011062 [Colletotrichum siamense]KAF4880135.1 hypothetical protein CGCSCA1_v001010 [Colletotrichum siamense]